jgi:hypothetical protein
MEPIDLTKHAPRSPREKLLGLYFLARTIDKIRGGLPGGDIGRYTVDYPQGASVAMCRRIRVELDELKRVVAEAESERDVVAWVAANADLTEAAAYNDRLEALTIEDWSDDERARLARYHPIMHERPELIKLLDIFEADDAALF